jgi:hypothetical protein
MERLTKPRSHERQVIARRSRNDARKGGMHRNDQLNAGLLLFDVNGTVTDVLSPVASENSVRLTRDQQRIRT